MIIDIDGTTFSCQACGKTFKDKSNCRRHVRSTHFQEVSADCTVCEKVFKNKNSLKCHMRAVHTNYKSMQETTQVWMWYIYLLTKGDNKYLIKMSTSSDQICYVP